jgi:hypothetical protein
MVNEGDLLKITGAKEVLVLTKIDLLNYYNNTKIPVLKASLKKNYADYNNLVVRHVKIHGEIFNRTRLYLGGGDDRNLTSEELIMKSKADACKEILGWLSNNYWNSNLMTTHNPGQYFNTDLSGGFPALIIRMLIELQPGLVEVMPAWPSGMPAGKIEGVALRGQILLKKLEWNGNNISITLR